MGVDFLDPAGAAELLSSVVPREGIIYLGEVHERPWLVETYSKVIRGLCGQLRFLGVEYFNVDQQGLLDEWLSGKRTWRGLVEEYSRGPEGFNLDVYRPMLEAARECRVPILGVMPPRNVANRVARTGVVEDLPSGAPDPARYMGVREYRELVSSLFPRSGPMARIPVERLLLAQSYKDSVAAWRVSRAAGELGVPGVVIMGWAHVEPVGAVATRVRDTAGVPGLVVGAREGSPDEVRGWYERWGWALETGYVVVG